MQRRNSFDYYESFIDCADCALRAANHLNETTLNFNPSDLARRMDEMHVIEHDADNINHSTLDRLAREFLPPIEREDIVTLTHELDNVVDAIDDLMRRMCMYDITVLKPETKEFSELLVRCCEYLKTLATEFKSFKKSEKIKEALVEINSLETEGDSLHFAAVCKLFNSRENALDVIIWKEIFDGFEECYDSCEHVADAVESVILKNS